MGERNQNRTLGYIRAQPQRDTVNEVVEKVAFIFDKDRAAGGIFDQSALTDQRSIG